MQDKEYMLRAIELAKRGAGHTNPNPMVGAVIVKNGEIIGEGWHHAIGCLHAEREALKACIEDPAGATIYVTLEPCCHHGRQPPCTEAILAAGIKKVVIGSRDPNPLVHGKGVAFLREHGIEVVEDFMREECDALNPIFFHYIVDKTPYVALKYAMTADGKIASASGKSKWITGEKARQHVHELRNLYSGIMVGIGTVLADDPMLNCRIDGGINPTRIVADGHLSIPLDCNLVKTAGDIPTLVFCAEDNSEKRTVLEATGVSVYCTPDENGRVDMAALFRKVGELGIDSVLVEGGGTVNDAILRAGLADRVYAYIAPKLLGGRNALSPVSGMGFDSPNDCVMLSEPKMQCFGGDILLEYEVIRCLQE